MQLRKVVLEELTSDQSNKGGFSPSLAVQSLRLEKGNEPVSPVGTFHLEKLWPCMFPLNKLNK